MAARDAEDLTQVGKVTVVAPDNDDAERAERPSTFHVYLNGELHSVVQGTEAFVRHTVIALSYLFPDDRWGYAPAQQPEGSDLWSCVP